MGATELIGGSRRHASQQAVHRAAQAHRQQSTQAAVRNAQQQRLNQLAALRSRSPDELTTVVRQSILEPGERVADGRVVQAVTAAWFTVINELLHDERAREQLDWRQWEEVVAGAYSEEGFDVILTPRSNDGGRDVIATLPGQQLRIVDQVKAYRPGHLVTAEEVRALIGVLTVEGNVSKGIVTTTSDFAPGVLKDPKIQTLVPYRLELKNGIVLQEWLHEITQRDSDSR